MKTPEQKLARAEYMKAYQEENRDKIKASKKAYQEENRDKIKANKKAYYEANSDKIKASNKAYQEAHREANRDKRKATHRNYMKRRCATDPLFKATCAVRSCIRTAIKNQGYAKNSRTELILGCSFEEFKNHIESKFSIGMTWLNHGDWHIDHIIPMASANSEAEMLRLNHYTNLQPLWAMDNLKKGDSMNYHTIVLTSLIQDSNGHYLAPGMSSPIPTIQ
jgi:hypothetical protein